MCPVAHPGLRIGPYVLQQPLGRGGMAEVWRAQHDRWPAQLALKLVTAQTADGLRDEVRAAAALDHPNVVQILDVGGWEIEGQVRPWLVMELGTGTLRHQLGELGWAQVRDLLHQVLAGLAHAHAHGVIHRDLKPANVLAVGAGPTWKLADFGIAALLEDDQAASSGTTGTPRFMAPEQILGRWRDQGPWTDLYALGCVVHELASWAHPFAGLSALEATHQQVSNGLPPLDLVIDAPAALVAWVQRLTARRPEDRFQRAGEAARALTAIDPGSRPRPSTPSPRVWLPGSGLGLVGLRSLPLVGRADAQATLTAAADRVLAERRLHAVQLTGPAGVGKSALAEWLAVSEAASARFDVLRASHSQVSTPRDGLNGMMSRALRVRELGHDGIRARLERTLPPDVAEALAAVLARPGPIPTDQRFAAFRLWLAQRQHPIILWLDDVQWGAEAVRFVRWLATTDPLPVLVLLAARTESLAAHPRVAAALERLAPQRIDLGPLDDLGRRELVRSLLGLTPTLAAEVTDRSDGNPLFAVQLVEHMVQRGVLEPGPSGFALVDGAAPTLPAGLTDVWSARLATLLASAAHPDAETALAVAAALGSRVPTDLWRQACARAGFSPPADLADRMHAQGLAAVDDEGWAFVHGMLREAVAERSRERGSWAACCDAVAQVLDVEREPGRVALLLLDAGRLEDAIEPLRLHAIILSQSGRPAAALAALNRRAAALDALGTPAGDRSRVSSQVARARFMTSLGDVEGARELAKSARDRAVEAGWRSLEGDAGNALAVTERILGDAQASRAAAESALAAFTAADDRIGIVRAHGLLADVWQGDVRLMIDRIRAGLDGMADSHATGALYANMLTRLANLYWSAGDLDTAGAMYVESVDRFRALGNRNLQGQCVMARAAIAWRRSDLDAADRLQAEAKVLLEPLGLPRTRSALKVADGVLARARGDRVTAEQRVREALRIQHDSGMRNRPEAELVLALLLLETGRTGELRSLVDRIRRRYAQLARPDQLASLELLEANAADGPEVYEAAAKAAEALLRGPAWQSLPEPDQAELVRSLRALVLSQGWPLAPVEALEAALDR
ncbi:MAG: hypothetical protein ACI8PZ_006006 [Myxococcota bacterium]|jgi:hypothetical protein